MKKRHTLRLKVLCIILTAGFAVYVLILPDPVSFFTFHLKYSSAYRFIKAIFFSLSLEENIAVWRQCLSNSSTSESATPRIIVLPVFSLLTDPSYNMEYYNGTKLNNSTLEARMNDFVESVQYSLDHRQVARVHVMFNQDAMPRYLLKRLGSNLKLRFERVQSTYVVWKIFEFIHTRFRNQLVLLTNGDVYPGEGLEYANYDLMNRTRLFYSPSRHGRQEHRCSVVREHCDKFGQYFESHDSYIFVPKEPFPDEAKAIMEDIVWDSYGMENVVLFVYHSILKYRVLNPCYVIYMYHNHCSNLRHSYRRQYLNISRFHDAEPSSELV